MMRYYSYLDFRCTATRGNNIMMPINFYIRHPSAFGDLLMNRQEFYTTQQIRGIDFSHLVDPDLMYIPDFPPNMLHMILTTLGTTL